VRTPEYVVFDDVRREPWECVRGMDQSFGFNRNSRPEHFLTTDELLDMQADIVAKGGNLLLNVGPRGEDAAIPERQLALLDDLATWTSGPGTSMHGSRPWARPSAETADGASVRFWAADRSVWAAIGGRSDGTVTVPGIGPTPTTSVSVCRGGPSGSSAVPLPWAAVDGGIAVALPGAGSHVVIRFEDVDAVPV
jgi:alpha-L-fucosidase